MWTANLWQDIADHWNIGPGVNYKLAAALVALRTALKAPESQKED